MRATRAAARPSSAVPAASSTSGRVPMTRISSPSLLTSGGPANQPPGSFPANRLGDLDVDQAAGNRRFRVDVVAGADPVIAVRDEQFPPLPEAPAHQQRGRQPLSLA